MEVEEARTAIFVRGTHTGEVLNGVMRELVDIFLSHVFQLVNLLTVVFLDRWR